jgi:hypothetical protein
MFERAAHQRVAALLGALDVEHLQRSKCVFGGGTRIALELGEYRESRDVDFLVSDADAYASLRMLVRERGCAAVPVRRPPSPAALTPGYSPEHETWDTQAVAAASGALAPERTNGA